MITRYALFEGRIADGKSADFREAVLSELMPIWRTFPGAVAMRVSFAEERDEGAPEIAMILELDYPDRDALTRTLESPIRLSSREATMNVMARYFEGRIHHHVTEAHAFPPA